MLSRLSPITILCATAFVAVGELASGTKPEFVLAVIVIMVCAGLTFNMLDGLTSLAGILYAEFAARTIVISQFVKVALFERADKNLEAPYLTITLYAIFFTCVMASIFVFGRFRLPVPRPLEPVNKSHARKLYVVALVVGTIATAVWDATNLNPTQVHNLAGTLSSSLSGLLLFSVVIAVDQRIQNTSGRHSLGWDAVLPILLLLISSLVADSREAFATPLLVYFACAWVRGYHFRMKHLALAVGSGLIFYFVISPIYLYNRGELRGEYFSDRVQTSFRILSETRSHSAIAAAQDFSSEGDDRFDYYNGTVSDVINRFALVRPDSDLINACVGGYRYGWATIRNDFFYALPHFLYHNKPENDSSAITGHTAGLNGEWEATAETAFSSIADSYAGFGVLGLVLFGLFGLPLFLLVCRSAFDITKPWGLVALGGAIANFGEWLVGRTLINAVEFPLMLFGISWVVGTLALLVPTRGDNFGSNADGVHKPDENAAAVVM